MRIYFWFLLGLLFGIVACEPQEDVLQENPEKALTFSTDTVFFDTVFNQIETPTRRLWIRNPNAGAVLVNVRLEDPAANTPFRLIINGSEQNNDIRVLGKDSILVIVSATIPEQNDNAPLLIEDFLVAQTSTATQRIPVHAWGRNAILVRDYVVSDFETWTAERPFVLLNNLVIDSLAQLTLGAGVEIYGYPDAFILVAGGLRVEGTAEQPVLLTGLRQEENFIDAPGQWGGIVTAQGSQEVNISYASIRNALWGIRAGTPDNDTIPDVRLQNVIIENMSDAGVLAFGSDVWLENTLINNCLNQTFAALAGGTYTLNHVTLANFSFDFLRQDPSIIFSDLFVTQGIRFEEDLTVRVQNSILWGGLDEEIFINDEGTGTFTLEVSHSLLRTQQADVFGLDTTNILNEDPRFILPFLYNYRLDTLSPAKDKGRRSTVTLDLRGEMRDSLPDMGAYERLE